MLKTNSANNSVKAAPGSIGKEGLSDLPRSQK